MRNLLCALICLLGSTSVLAESSYVSNPYQPYPPGCANVPGPFSYVGYRGYANNFWDGDFEVIRDIKIDGENRTEKINVGFKIFRVNCPTRDRSLVWLQFVLPETLLKDRAARIELPTAEVELPSGERISMNLAEQPNLWGENYQADRGRILLRPQVQRTNWGALQGSHFLLDNFPKREEGDKVLTASQYNGEFKLILRYESDYTVGIFHVPSTAELFSDTPEKLPLSGRLSGLWVVPGAADQGFNLAVSSLPQKPSAFSGEHTELLVLFLAHYTFDNDGNPMWLTGSANFGPATYQATISMLMVTGGHFMSGSATGRAIVGTIRILGADDCNHLRIRYEYPGLIHPYLASGEVTLQRLFSLETAGYDCRDYEAKLAAANQ